MLGKVIALSRAVEAVLREENSRGVFSAAVCRIAIDGETIVSVALGELAHVDDEGQPISPNDCVAVEEDTLFDLASVTKVFSAHTLMMLVDRGELHLDAPIAFVLPEYANGAKSSVTLRHLLTHTSGLPATWDGWCAPLSEILQTRSVGSLPLRESPIADRHALVADLLATDLNTAPGTRWEYSCTGFNTAMILAERATSRSWPTLVAETTLVPLGLRDTSFSPDVARTAATEYQPELGRGMVRGIVHDESSWSLGGACANAGLFGTSADLLALGEAIRIGATPVTESRMWENQLPDVLHRDYALDGDNRFGASLGLRIGELVWMGRFGHHSRGHTGFTGTSLQIDRGCALTIALMTNRVHPTRQGDGISGLRAAIADAAFDRAQGR